MIERVLSFDQESHSADAIQRAAYRFSDRLSIDLRPVEGAIRCTVSVLSDDPVGADEIVHEFKNEVLDQVLRERIRAETAGMRNTILALAFSKTSLVQQD